MRRPYLVGFKRSGRSKHWSVVLEWVEGLHRVFHQSVDGIQRRLKTLAAWLARLKLLLRFFHGLGVGLYEGGRWWLSVFVTAARRFDQHDCVMRSAAIAYYALISFFPLILLLIVGVSFVLESSTAQSRVIQLVEANIPTSVDLIKDNIRQILRVRGTISLVAIATFLWSASSVFSTIDRAMNRIWDAPTLRPYWRQLTIAFLAITAIGAMTVLSLTTTAAVNFVKNTVLPILARYWDISIGPWQALVVSIPYLSSILLFMIVYRIFPYVELGWGDVWPGALVAGCLWEEAKRLFGQYLAHFSGRQNLVYGSVGAIIALLIWFYLTAFILLAGAEISATYSAKRREANRTLDSNI